MDNQISREEFNEILAYFTKFHGLFYQLWKMGIPRYDTAIPTAAVGFNREGEFIDFMICKEFWETKTLSQKTFIIAHECMHIIRNHGIRSVNKQYDMKVANKAMDLTVNHSLIDYFGFKRSEVDPDNMYCWIDTVFKNYSQNDYDQSFEYYYTKLQKQQNASANDKDNGAGGRDGDSAESGNELVDDHGSLFNSEEILRELGEKLTEAEKQELSDKLSKSCGDEFGGMEFFVPKAKVVVKRKWETVIKKWASQYLKYSSKNHLQWIRTNRRYVTLPKDYFLHNEYDEDVKHIDNHKITVYFFADTSGSCASYASRFFKAAESLPKDRFDVRLFCFDTKVYETTLKSRKLYGGGGTSFAIIENYIQRMMQKDNSKYPAAIFVITDGIAAKFKCEKPKNWYWFLTPNNSKSAIPEGSSIFNLKDYE